jgi:hypothetical protein
MRRLNVKHVTPPVLRAALLKVQNVTVTKLRALICALVKPSAPWIIELFY